MIKIFTLNENKKIELTETELKRLLDDAYHEGYKDGNTGKLYWTYQYPSISRIQPYYSTTTQTNKSVKITYRTSFQENK